MLKKLNIMVLALAIVFAISACSAKGDAAKGKVIYVENCEICHGNAGKGDGAASAVLNPKPTDFTNTALMSKRTANDLFKVVTKGVPNTGMAPYEKMLSEKERWDVVAYIRTFAQKARSSAKGDAAKEDDERFIFSDLTVKDKETRLIWTRDANIADKEMTWKDAFKFVKKLNKQKYAGYSDWRLPTIEELKTLTHYAKGQGNKGYYNDLFNKIGFRNVEAYSYWSSSAYDGSTAYAWIVFMVAGHVDGLNKTFTSYVWPVRGGK